MIGRLVRAWRYVGDKRISVSDLNDSHRAVTPLMQSWMRETGKIKASVFCGNEPLLFVDASSVVACRSPIPGLTLHGARFENDELTRFGIVYPTLIVGCSVEAHAAGHDIAAVLLSLALAVEDRTKIDVLGVVVPLSKS